jgi:hypothetical protein
MNQMHILARVAQGLLAIVMTIVSGLFVLA